MLNERWPDHLSSGEGSNSRAVVKAGRKSAEVDALGLVSYGETGRERDAWPDLGSIVESIGNMGKRVSDVLDQATDKLTDSANSVSGMAKTVASVAGAVDDIVDSVAGVNESTANPGVLDWLHDAAKNVQNGADTVSNISQAVGGLVGDFSKLMDQLAAFALPIERGGNSIPQINRTLCYLLGCIVLVVLAGILLEQMFPLLRPSEGRPRLWCLGALIASYCMLIPGLVEVLFSFTIGLDVLGLRVTVTKRSEDLSKPGPTTESMKSVVHKLTSEGAHLGAFFIVLYSMVIPAVKLALLIIGEVFRFSTRTSLVIAARWSIRLVQVLSKWACPDMFAYILILYLMRSLDERSPLLTVPCHLDVGFVCFTIFCVCSTFSSLAITLPEWPESDAQAAEGEVEGTEPNARSTAALPEPVQGHGHVGQVSTAAALMVSPPEEAEASTHELGWVTGLLALIFAVLYTFGLLIPCMGMKIESELLVQPQGPLPAAVLPVLQFLKLEQQINADVSLWSCLCSLLRWWYRGEATCVLALIMLGCFALLLPVVNMVLLFLAAENAASEAAGSAHWLPEWTSGAMAAAHVIKHIEMLDVTVMGVAVVCWAGKSFREQGIMILMRSGLLFLLLAEIVHYTTYYFVQYASGIAKKRTAQASA